MKNTGKEDIKRILRKQSYRFVGRHSAVKICEWNKQALRGYGECYKHKFYSIPSWRCCQMSPWLPCDNHCLHCWRPIELDMKKAMVNGKIDSPEAIINGCIIEQRKLLTGFGGYEKGNRKRFEEAQEPSHFAISLIGEPTVYPKIGELVSAIRKLGKTSFIVSNGLHPEIIKKLERKKQLPTQLYVSLNASNKEEYEKWHNSKLKDAWKRYNTTLGLLNKLTKKGKRTVLRMTIVRGMNMDEKHIKEFAELIKRSGVLFVEVKSFMSLGYSRQRIGYEKMPSTGEIRRFSKKLAKASGYVVLGLHDSSRIVLLGKNKAARKRMKIKANEI